MVPERTGTGLDSAVSESNSRGSVAPPIEIRPKSINRPLRRVILCEYKSCRAPTASIAMPRPKIIVSLPGRDGDVVNRDRPRLGKAVVVSELTNRSTGSWT